MRRLLSFMLLAACMIEEAWVDLIVIEVSEPFWRGQVVSRPRTETGPWGAPSGCGETPFVLDGSFEGEGTFDIEVVTESEDERGSTRLWLWRLNPLTGEEGHRPCVGISMPSEAGIVEVGVSREEVGRTDCADAWSEAALGEMEAGSPPIDR